MPPHNATPRREVKTPGSLSGLGKENAEPSHGSYYDSEELTMTAFFNRVRTYKVQSKHYSPVVLTTLMDVGHVKTPNSSDELAKRITHADATASHGKFCSPRICSRFELTVSQRPGLGRTRPCSRLLRSLMDMVRLYH